MRQLTLHEEIQLFPELFENADSLRVVGPVAEVRRLDVGAMVQQNSTYPLVPRVASHSQCILVVKLSIRKTIT